MSLISPEGGCKGNIFLPHKRFKTIITDFGGRIEENMDGIIVLL